jgi:DNA-binding HxlR family transcriptional regulator
MGGGDEMPPADHGSKPRRQWAPDARALSIVGDRWIMVIIRDLAAGPLRLDALRRWLPGVSSGALETRLARMAEEGLLVRHRHRSLPPRVDLELTERGYALVDTIGELARWELRTYWSRPIEGEWVDVAACFRLAPFLTAPETTAPDGEIALTLIGPDGARDEYAYISDDGRTKVEHRPAPDTETRMSGTQEAWVEALSPDGSSQRLTMEGSEPLAASFLELFKAQPR